MTIATPISARRCRDNRVKASRPPAEPPTQTTGKSLAALLAFMDGHSNCFVHSKYAPFTVVRAVLGNSGTILALDVDVEAEFGSVPEPHPRLCGPRRAHAPPWHLRSQS